jgi:hypothetical protein
VSYYRRGYSWEQIHYVGAPTGGWNPDANQWTLPANQAPVLDNFLLRPGKVVMRGPFKVSYDLSSAAPLNVAGWVGGADLPTGAWWLISRKVVSSTAFVDPWNAPLVGTSAAKLAGANVTCRLTEGGTSVGIGLPSVSSCPGPRSINFDGYVYNIAYDSSVAAVASFSGDYSMKPVQLQFLRNPQAPSFPDDNPIPCTGAPHGAFDLIGHQSRIWLLGGIDTPGAGTTHSPTALFFSNPIAAGGGFNASDWSDPVSGLTNQITMDRNYADFGVALAPVRAGLVVLRYSSVWLLRGTTTATYVLQQISNQAGCIDARSVVECDSGVYFLSHEGLMFTDGVRVANVSGSCKTTIQSALEAEQSGVRSSFGGYASCAVTSSGAILVSIGLNQVIAGAPTGHIQPLWCGLYDPAAKAWTRITSQLWQNDAVQVSTNYYPGLLLSHPERRQLFALGDKYLTQLEDMSIGQTFMLPEGAPGGCYDQLPSGGSPYVSIPAVWKTRLVPLVGTTTLARKFGQAKRFFIDYVFGGTGLVPAVGWSALPVNASDTAYTTALPATLGSSPTQSGSVSGVTSSASPSIQRQDQDFVNEVDDLGFDITWSDVARASRPTGVVAELYGIGVEYQPTRDLR